MASTAAVEVKSSTRVFNGTLIRFTHQSQETRTPMTCAVYIPTTSSGSETFPTLLYLSGLTCTDENVCQKSGIFKKLSELRMGFVAPDTSPRGAGIPGETDSWDMGAGAGFYLDATAEPWAQHYKMYSYITKELMVVLKDNFAALDLTRMGVTGHSMGGHGALTIALKNQHMFKSVSAFAPICNPKVRFAASRSLLFRSRSPHVIWHSLSRTQPTARTVGTEGIWVVPGRSPATVR